MDYGLKVSLIKAGFAEVEPWTRYKHDNGLIVTADEHEWNIEDETGTWAEEGSLNDTGPLWMVIDDHTKGNKE